MLAPTRRPWPRSANKQGTPSRSWYRPYRNNKAGTPRRCPASCWSVTAARYRVAAKRSKGCPESAARPPTWSSTPCSANPRWRSTPTSSGRQPHRLAPGQGRARSRASTQPARPEGLPVNAHHWLILHGYVCKARKPELRRCLHRARPSRFPRQDRLTRGPRPASAPRRRDPDNVRPQQRAGTAISSRPGANTAPRECSRH